MGKLIVTEYMTLDGVAQGPGGPEEDEEGSFAHGGWQAPLIDHETGDVVFEQSRSMDALLLGRRTYDIFASYWPTAPDDIPFKALLNGVPKYVASNTLSEPLSWEGTSLLKGDLAESVAEIKQRHETVAVIGSLDLLQSLLRLGLVDELRLWQYPVLLGSGKKVFGSGTVPAALRLEQAISYPGGAVQLTYQALGTTPGYGDMAEVSAG
ncbi:dihydrofolate reductase family protein [Kineosporia rhizophila]|uniref:dihydrofolate reductase family protein n=1 Tax=Kineosporia TaxID=49184 RepID=UPI000B24A846|nr:MULTISPECIES: dihydrofolate reductase family protein [Kineosporia]MCE0534132.1 dihydrofolate reductase family protein [Kineosporia rhizophila]GLY13678.1 deaminase reductase [Kineosporia sp. NBRC 101677]